MARSSERQGRRRADERTADLCERYFEALVAADASVAEVVLREALGSGIPAATVYARVVQPALERIGAQWQSGELSVGVEHAATAISKRALAAVYPLVIEGAVPNGVRVLLAGISGEQHSMGVRVIADVLDGAGFDTIYLGADTPPDAIADAVRLHRPHLAGLALTMPEDVGALARAVAAVATTDPSVSVIIGGRGVPEALRAYEGYVADAEGVVGTALRLVEEAPVRPKIEAGAASGMPSLPELADGDPVERELVSTAADLADLVRVQARRARDFRLLALTDPVTGMPNRRAWDERFAELASGVPLAALVVDLDGFKEVNDRAGHQRGDGLLARVGAAIRDAVRAGDFAARLGGDEFGVLLPGTDVETAAVIGERVRAAIARSVADEGVTASIGVAEHRRDPRGTTLAADRALYRAKIAGGDRVARETE